LTAAGHVFENATDADVLPHLSGRRWLTAPTPTARSAGPPLVLGVDEDASYLTSDVPAFLEFTDCVLH